MNLRKLALPLTIAFLLTLSVFTLSAIEYDGPLHDSGTDEPCLGPEDPFCGEGGGGGDPYEGPCKLCTATTLDDGTPTSVTCKSDARGKGDECSASFDSEGNVECTVKGSC